MPNGAVLFDSVWKRFRRGERHDTLRELIPTIVGHALRPSRDHDLRDQEFWAVRDLSFEVKPGEALGIIGPNGAGKSTALKLLTRILKPTRGRCEIRGRAGALIDLAAGFRLELTGRENIYMRGAILGMTRSDTAAKFDDIVSFAGLSAFIDTPVKRYSSGMSARLGFAVASQLNPDVLVVDEVLGVGDAEFRQRCHERMSTLKRSGVVIVVVSHNMAGIRALCDRTLLLKDGVAAFLGSTDEAVRRYGPPDQRKSLPSPPAAPARPGLPVVGTLRIQDIDVPTGRSGRELQPGDVLKVRLRASVEDMAQDLVLLTQVRARASGDVASATRQRLQLTGDDRSRKECELIIDVTVNLLRGAYVMTFSLLAPSRQSRLRSPAIVFRVRERDSTSGVAYLRTTATIAGLPPVPAGSEYGDAGK